jgi:peptidoglycan/LPS O-acetylase OafA/YrhL
MTKRIDEIDSLRGLAALSVVFHHFLISLPYIKSTSDNGLIKLITNTPLHIFWSGNEAVILFFVLSGFVLSIPLSQGNTSYRSFVIKRICRIYIPYLVAVVVAIIVKLLISEQPIAGFSDWFNGVSATQPTSSKVLDHLLFLGYYKADLDPVTWSLVHEMRISLIFPIIMLLVIKTDWKTSIGVGLFLACISIVISHFLRPKYSTDYLSSIQFIVMFIAGALLARYRNNLTCACLGLTRTGKAALFLLGIIAYWYPLILNLPMFLSVMGDWVTTIGACVFVIMAFSSNTFSRVLLVKPVHFLGQISYSLYLYHAIFLISLVNLLHSHFPIIGILFICLIVSTVAASLSYYFVEIPSVHLGRFLSKGHSYKESKVSAAVVDT